MADLWLGSYDFNGAAYGHMFVGVSSPTAHGHYKASAAARGAVKLGHLAIALVESIPLLGGVASLIETIAARCLCQAAQVAAPTRPMAPVAAPPAPRLPVGAAPPAVTTPLLGAGASPIQQMAQRDGYVSFYDSRSDPRTAMFGNFYPCQLVYQGRQYGCSEAAFQAQKYTDQPAVLALFDRSTTGDAAVQLARQYPMTAGRLAEWDSQQAVISKDDVMMAVLRAKFQQNPALQQDLLDSGDAYLVEHLPDAKRRDRYWSDGYDGSGQNRLGGLLMELREELGGSGAAAAPPACFALLGPPAKAPAMVAPVAPKCMLPVCAESIFPGYKFCGRTHGQQYVSLYGRCKVCREPNYYDATTKKAHQFCSRSCARSYSG